MKRREAFLIAAFFWLCISVNSADRAVLVHNTC